MAPFIFSLANFTPTILIGFKEDLTTKYLDRERSGAMPRLIIYIYSLTKMVNQESLRVSQLRRRVNHHHQIRRDCSFASSYCTMG
jgi:hypothetical protein